MNANEEIKSQKRHAIRAILLWALIAWMNLSDILELGIHKVGVRHWIFLGLGILVVIFEIVNLLRIRRQQKEL